MNRDVVDVVRAYFMMGDEMGIDWIRDQAEMVEAADHWDRLAVSAGISDLLDQQKLLTRHAIQTYENGAAIDSVKAWLKNSEAARARINKLIKEFQSTGQINVTKLGFAARQLRNVVAG